MINQLFWDSAGRNRGLPFPSGKEWIGNVCASVWTTAPISEREGTRTEGDLADAAKEPASLHRKER